MKAPRLNMFKLNKINQNRNGLSEFPEGDHSSSDSLDFKAFIKNQNDLNNLFRSFLEENLAKSSGKSKHCNSSD